jgi:hypothetical protein
VFSIAIAGAYKPLAPLMVCQRAHGVHVYSRRGMKLCLQLENASSPSRALVAL